MSCFCEKQQRDRDEKEWDHSTTSEQENETHLFCQSGSEPALPSISDSSLSHSLCVSYHCSVSFSQMAVKQKVVSVRETNIQNQKIFKALPFNR